jgi:nucleoside-diphosphate-sugar epimerase
VRVIVTGGTSLLGNAVARQLQGRGDDVVLFQRRSGGDDFEEALGDVTDALTVHRAVAGCDAVVHAAAKVGISGDRSDYERSNVGGTANVIAAAHAAGVKRFVHISSPSVAHAGESLVGAGAGPADPAGARGDYARSKAEAELLALEAGSPDFPLVVLRPHLVWGPGDTQLVGRIVDRARQGRLATVGSGLALIDTTYIDNAAEAVIAALDRCPDISGRAFVVSNGQPRPVAELVRRIVRAAGLEPPRVTVPAPVAKTGGMLVERAWARTGRDDEPPMTSFLAEQLATAHWFDQRATRAALQWEPRISIREGFTRLEDWYSRQR